MPEKIVPEKMKLIRNVSGKRQGFSRGGKRVTVEPGEVVRMEDVTSGSALPPGFEHYQEVERFVPTAGAPAPGGAPKVPFEGFTPSEDPLAATLGIPPVPPAVESAPHRVPKSSNRILEKKHKAVPLVKSRSHVKQDGVVLTGKGRRKPS